jgi:hypothetical protein
MTAAVLLALMNEIAEHHVALLRIVRRQQRLIAFLAACWVFVAVVTLYTVVWEAR